MADPKPIDQSENGPRMEVIDRMKNIPVISSAIEKTGSTYTYVKDSHQLVNRALSAAEAGLQCATATVAPITSPLVKRFEGSISTVDHTLCAGLDIVEKKVPLVAQPPEQIYNAAKSVMSSSLQPTIAKLHSLKESATQQATTLKEISMTKANEILSTHYGSLAVQGIDNTSVMVNKLLDHYFPEVEEMDEVPAPVSADESKILHAVQTIGQLSTKTANRVYHSVAAQMKTIKKEDVAAYVSSAISILHLTDYLHGNQRQITATCPESPAGEEPKAVQESK